MSWLESDACLLWPCSPNTSKAQWKQSDTLYSYSTARISNVYDAEKPIFVIADYKRAIADQASKVEILTLFKILKSDVTPKRQPEGRFLYTHRLLSQYQTCSSSCTQVCCWALWEDLRVCSEVAPDWIKRLLWGEGSRFFFFWKIWHPVLAFWCRWLCFGLYKLKQSESI